jgi:hypothetical protein
MLMYNRLVVRQGQSSQPQKKGRLKSMLSGLAQQIKDRFGLGKPKLQRAGTSCSYIVMPLLFLPAIPLISYFSQYPLDSIIILAFGIAAGIIICWTTYTTLPELISKIMESIRQKDMTFYNVDTTYIFLISSLGWFLALMLTGIISGAISGEIRRPTGEDSIASPLGFVLVGLNYFLGVVLGMMLYTQEKFWQSKKEEFFKNRELAAKRKLAKQACEEKNLEVLIELLGDYFNMQDYVVKLLVRISEASRAELIRILKDYARIEDDSAGRYQIVGAAKALRQMDGVPADQTQEAYLLIAEELAKKDKIGEDQDWQSLVKLGQPALDPLRELLQELPEEVMVTMADYDDFGSTLVASENDEYSNVLSAIIKIRSTDSDDLKQDQEGGDKNLKKRKISQEATDSAVRLAIENGEAMGINIKTQELRDLSPAGIAKLFEDNNNDMATRLTSVFKYSSDDARIKARDKLAQYLARSPDSENELKSALEMISTNIKESSLLKTSRLVILLSENDIFSQGQVLAHSGKKSIYIHINALHAARNLGMNEIIKTILEHEDRDLARGYHADDISDKDFARVRELWEAVILTASEAQLADVREFVKYQFRKIGNKKPIGEAINFWITKIIEKGYTLREIAYDFKINYDL